MAAKGGVMGSIKKVAIAAAIAAIAAAVIAPAASANEYPGPADSKQFTHGPGGYTGSEAHGGLCLILGVTCPAVSNSWQPSGGVGLKQPDGFLRTSLGSLTGVAAVSQGIWTSPLFKYRGLKGGTPNKVLFKMRSRANVDELLNVLGNQADFTAEIVHAPDGVVVDTPWNHQPLGDHDWTMLPRINVGDGALNLNENYFIRITTEFISGVDVISGATADWDNVILETR
jgi:hypothetical protein